ncbi:hypothetical protein CEY15_08860 [Dietzia natronolimnaea]|uniref:DUF2020 domain-containing protein n=2 Tax=Dietziaceae TaxID=85029 RepID=A0A2A2WR51_9ACTN|nr:hypothetical protein CEY15_08860 [Dietzia natronolimnaea]
MTLPRCLGPILGIMRIATTTFLAPMAVVLLGVSAGCGGGDGDPAPEMGTIRTAPPETSEPEIPQVEPVTREQCPYLSVDEASRLNGELATDVRIDDRVDPAACFFYGADGAVQLTTTVYSVASEERATELVDDSAPVGESERSDVEGGWTGGRTGGPGGALVVLARGTQVLAVQSTQEQSVKVQRVAELVAPRIAD